MKGYSKLRVALLGTAFVATAKALSVVEDIKNSEQFKRAVDTVDDIVSKVKAVDTPVQAQPEHKKSIFDESLDTVLMNIEAMSRRDEEKRQQEEVKYESVFSFLTHRARYMSNPELREYLLRALNLEIDQEGAELIRHFILRAGVQYTNVWDADEPTHKTMGDFFRSMVGKDIDREVLLKLIYRHMNYHKTTFFISNFDLDNISSGFATRSDIDTLIDEHGLDNYSFVESSGDDKEHN